MVMTSAWTSIKISETTKQRLNHTRVPPETTDDAINRLMDDSEKQPRVLGPKIYDRVMRLKRDSDTPSIFLSRVLDHYDGSIWLKPNSERQARNRMHKRREEEK
jgi:uncharacterized protein with von Willebrand factor type A (vWA) domain